MPPDEAPLPLCHEWELLTCVSHQHPAPLDVGHDVENSVDLTPFRKAYRATFEARSDADLTAACDIAVRLGWVCSAVNGHLHGENEKTFTRLVVCL